MSADQHDWVHDGVRDPNFLAGWSCSRCGASVYTGSVDDAPHPSDLVGSDDLTCSEYAVREVMEA